MSGLKHWIWLAELPGLHSQTRLALLSHFGDPENIYYADPEEILLVEGMTREQAEILKSKSLDRVEQIIGECRRLRLRILTMQDADYPERLRNIFDPPCVLYVKGHMPAFDEELPVAVIGTRTCTPYGVQCADKLGGQLAAGGAVVVSGLARGVDTAAIRGALRAGGVTVGVLGCGIDVIYPPENRYLYEDVSASGVLVSEYPPGTEAKSGHFPARNRIISGLSAGVLVVEAPAKSGALITAELALQQGRDLYAIPGPIDAKESVGCNELIRQGAGLVTCGWDILQEYEARFPGKLRCEDGCPQPKKEPGGETKEPAKPLPRMLSLSREGGELTDDQILLLRSLTDDPILVDDLIEAVQIPARRVLSALTMLEVDDYVVQHPGKRYARNVLLCE